MAIIVESFRPKPNMKIISVLILIPAEYKCFIRTIKYAGRYLKFGAKVALDNRSAIRITTKCPVGAGYYARPTADTLLRINDNPVTPELFLHRAGKT